MTISFKKSLKLPEGLLFQELANGELVFLNLNNESYFGLDEIGKDIWNELHTSNCIETAYNNLLEKYEVDSKTLKNDMLDLIPQLIDNGLLEYS